MVLLNAANNAATTLTSSITAGATNIPVVSVVPFPAVPFVVTAGTEIIRVNAVDAGTNTFTAVVRGQEGTTAQAHAAGTAVEHRFTAGMYNSHHNLVASVHGAISAPNANSIVLRDAAGRAQVAAPSVAADIARLDTVTTHEALTAPHSAVSTATANRLALRDANARMQAADGVVGDDVATRRQVMRPFSVVVAASNTTITGRNSADFVCDGIDDQVEINNALNSISAVGGCVQLLEGTYTIGASINLPANTHLQGQGRGTVLRLRNNHNTDISMLTNSGFSNITVSNLTIDGNSANQTSGFINGIRLHTNAVNCSVLDAVITNCRQHGVFLDHCTNANAVIRSNRFISNQVVGIATWSSTRVLIADNVCSGNGQGIALGNSEQVVIGNLCVSNQRGITTTGGVECIISGNVCRANTFGISITSGGAQNTVSGNVCAGNTEHGISIENSHHNVITGNVSRLNNRHGINLFSSSNNNINNNLCDSNSQATNNTYSNIFITANSDNNSIQGNTCRRGTGANQPAFGIRINTADCDANLVTDNDLLTGGATADFSNLGTGTIVPLDAHAGTVAAAGTSGHIRIGAGLLMETGIARTTTRHNNWITVTASRDIALADADNILNCNSASAIVLTIQPDATTNHPIGSEIAVLRYGTGAVTFAAGAGVTIRSRGNFLSISAQFASAALKKIAANEWALVGVLV